MIKAGIIGATGYAGAELVRLLAGHEEVRILTLGSRSYDKKSFSGIYGNMRAVTDADCEDPDMNAMAEACDVIFTATPQGYCAANISEEILKKTVVIDLSADFRLKDVSVYEKWYAITHAAPQLIDSAVYGLCELYREDIKKTRLVANPGCYTTCSILSLYPLVKEGLIDSGTIIIDAKSGTSGAGRSAKTDNLFCEVNENMKAYGMASHRHTPEIEQELGFASGEETVLNFTPHLVPMNRGILATCYASLKDGAGKEEIAAAYEKYYKDEYFIRLLPYGSSAQTRWVEGSNFTDIGFTVDERTRRVIVTGAIDNLVKGAAGQAVQNMNIVFGLPENTGLKAIPLFP